MKALGLRAWKWPFKSGEVKECVDTIERFQNHFNLTMQNDNA
jgi:hypothetical protein